MKFRLRHCGVHHDIDEDLSGYRKYGFGTKEVPHRYRPETEKEQLITGGHVNIELNTIDDVLRLSADFPQGIIFFSDSPDEILIYDGFLE